MCMMMQEKKHASMGHDQDHESIKHAISSSSSAIHMLCRLDERALDWTGDWKLHDSWLAVAMRNKLASMPNHQA